MFSLAPRRGECPQQPIAAPANSGCPLRTAQGGAATMCAWDAVSPAAAARAWRASSAASRSATVSSYQGPGRRGHKRGRTELRAAPWSSGLPALSGRGSCAAAARNDAQRTPRPTCAGPDERYRIDEADDPRRGRELYDGEVADGAPRPVGGAGAATGRPGLIRMSRSRPWNRRTGRRTRGAREQQLEPGAGCTRHRGTTVPRPRRRTERLRRRVEASPPAGAAAAGGWQAWPPSRPVDPVAAPAHGVTPPLTPARRPSRALLGVSLGGVSRPPVVATRKGSALTHLDPRAVMELALGCTTTRSRRRGREHLGGAAAPPDLHVAQPGVAVGQRTPPSARLAGRARLAGPGGARPSPPRCGHRRGSRRRAPAGLERPEKSAITLTRCSSMPRAILGEAAGSTRRTRAPSGACLPSVHVRPRRQAARGRRRRRGGR